MPPEAEADALRVQIFDTLERVIDPCSVAAGASAGLVSMGLVGDVAISDEDDGVHIAVTLRITSPTCMMAAIFEGAAVRELEVLPGVTHVEVLTDRTYLWHSDDMTPEYRQRLAVYRKAQAEQYAATQPAMQ